MGRSSSELVIGDVVEPVGLGVVAVSFEIYAVGFLSFVGNGVSKLSLECLRCIGRRMNTYWLKHVKHSQGDIQFRYVVSL